MAWSSQQEEALKKVKSWMREKNNQVFRLFGFAGTGKTTLAKEMANKVRGTVLYAAFTGKAASVMRQKGCQDAQTIHSLIYKIDELKGGEPKFILNDESEIREAKLVIVDECSMVDEQIGKDLLSFGKKILVLGDPAQLPPVKGAGFFTAGEPDMMLTEVHRQARDNPIIALSMKIRENEPILNGHWGDACRIISRDMLQREEVLGADQIIVGLNRTRQLYNNRVRQLKGIEGIFPVEGDKLVCLRNDRTKGIYNGTLWVADNVALHSNLPLVKLDISSAEEEIDPREVTVRREFFIGGEQNIPWKEKKGTQEFTYGYALTCHKSQGSQWDNVMVFDEAGAFREDAWRWRYTAVTRAAKALTLVRG